MHFACLRYLINQRTCFISSDWNCLTSSAATGSSAARIYCRFWSKWIRQVEYPRRLLFALVLPVQGNPTDLVNRQTPRGVPQIAPSLYLTGEPITPSHAVRTERRRQKPQNGCHPQATSHPQGTYTSTYYINGVTCTLTELHEQLNRLRIYPEGYNVVLQGCHNIISMNPRERRD